jgi:hypothetical protein
MVDSSRQVSCGDVEHGDRDPEVAGDALLLQAGHPLPGVFCRPAQGDQPEPVHQASHAQELARAHRGAGGDAGDAARARVGHDLRLAAEIVVLEADTYVELQQPEPHGRGRLVGVERPAEEAALERHVMHQRKARRIGEHRCGVTHQRRARPTQPRSPHRMPGMENQGTVGPGALGAGPAGDETQGQKKRRDRGDCAA